MLLIICTASLKNNVFSNFC